MWGRSRPRPGPRPRVGALCCPPRGGPRPATRNGSLGPSLMEMTGWTCCRWGAWAPPAGTAKEHRMQGQEPRACQQLACSGGEVLSSLASGVFLHPKPRPRGLMMSQSGDGDDGGAHEQTHRHSYGMELTGTAPQAKPFEPLGWCHPCPNTQQLDLGQAGSHFS